MGFHIAFVLTLKTPTQKYEFKGLLSQTLSKKI